MAYLKYLYVKNEANTFELSNTFELEKFSESDGIDKLSIISLLVLYTKYSQEFKKCTNLESSDCSETCSQFPLLNKLESLNMRYEGNVRVQCPCDLSFPSNLKKGYSL